MKISQISQQEVNTKFQSSKADKIRKKERIDLAELFPGNFKLVGLRLKATKGRKIIAGSES